MTEARNGEPSTSTPSEWHSIRPWTPHLTLAVREITSVSATFILSSSLDTRSSGEPDPEPELNIEAQNGSTPDALADSRGIIADAMSHGLSVDVNGSNWQRVILRMNDHADEAIIVIYGLHPGRQYDIDLALVSGGTVRGQVITEDAESSALDGERNDDYNVITAPEPIALTPSTSTVSDSSPSTPAPSPAPTPEDRLRTLSHQLNALHAEQAALQSTLKTSRRDANKTTTALRSEIDVLKRASEKAGIAEGKARQRVRALEDAVRRANEGRTEVEEATAADEQELPGLKEKQSAAETDLGKVKAEAEDIRAERERHEEEGRKHKESMNGECAALNQKLERLGVKKDRLEGSVIPDLEAQLAEIEREIEATERRGMPTETWDAVFEDSTNAETQRRRQSHPGTIGRPSQTTAQRPGQPQTQPISPPHFPRHQPRSQSAYRIGPDIGPPGLSHPPGLNHPPGLLHTSSSSMSHSGVSAFTNSQSSNPAFSHSISSSLSRSTSSVASSTLSSKAAPFEPTRNLRATLSSSTSSGPFPSSSSFPTNAGQGTFSPSAASTAFPSSGSSSSAFAPSLASAFPLSGAFPPIQRPSHATHSSTSGLGGVQVRSGRPPVSRGSTGEDPWTASSG
ncbi:hypothetical protein HYDPIDRAFT_31314 [Hydnomerulius pinastri MD-312]|uniref:Uncharacterized protein n=1 Tax=Hydnomerulius pinastri MD-312 TaxID=994086 RepID=A0A0C9VTV1_9AGAM|nr:hypothetical protein HYDPIDRAFT_31314 [Hydnomerulius pinastri MD-312]